MKLAANLAAVLNIVGIDLSRSKFMEIPKMKSDDWHVGRRKIRIMRPPDGGGIFGPAFGPSEDWAHESRQVRRANLFILAFQHLSRMYPGESRRTRRYLARQRANFQYRQASAALREDS